MSDLLKRNPGGFTRGYTPIVTLDDDGGAVGINFGILRCASGEKKDLASVYESAYLLIHGTVTFEYDNNRYTAARNSIFDEDPTVIHFAKSAAVTLVSDTDCELAVCQVKNEKTFRTMVFDAKNMLNSERRGKGILEDTSYRIVRTVFDINNRPESNMVLGEDINLQGRWSSYPPHHHPQPEIYHYRFTKPQGYAHAELGNDVYKVRDCDTIKILNRKDHAQVAAPGYSMYYLWVIRHLPGNPYTVPEFTEEHRWVLDPKASYWKPLC